MNSLPLKKDNGHIFLNTYTNSMKAIKVLVDTGASTTVCFNRDLLINVRKNDGTISGLNGQSKATHKGILVLIGILTTAYFIDEQKAYDAILGLDWMIAHNAIINLQTLTLEYD